MKYILFNQSAISYITRSKEHQSVEFDYGQELIDIIRRKIPTLSSDSLFVKETKNGIIFSGHEYSKTFLVYDLEQSNLVEKEKNDENLLLVLQKSFRTAIRIWAQQPFTSSERMHGTKSIVFPFVFTDRRRIVIERNPQSDRLAKRDVHRPLLVYKYGVEDAPRYEEYPSVKNLETAGEELLSAQAEIIKHFSSCNQPKGNETPQFALQHEVSKESVNDGGFRYLNYAMQFSKLTKTQRSVVENNNISSPIRIEGPAGTGKTASMLLRAYRLLEENRRDGKPFKVLFVAHSESTRTETFNSFSLLDNSDIYLSTSSKQRILFTTLFDYCIDTLRLERSNIIENDATEAKQTQIMLIADAAERIIEEKYKTYRPLLSNDFNKLIDKAVTPRNILISLLQHEFSIQIKGRTDGSYEEYCALQSIPNALPANSKNEKKFVYAIFKEYQDMLYKTQVYDNDDITVAALSHWNAPIWRRERIAAGFDYIFVDEMHLFSVNEQHAFHYLTKYPEQRKIPLCFALDYSQAIGDRGDISQDYIETNFGEAERNNYKTVFRSSPEITDFCAAIAASGALMFESNYKNPYEVPASGFTTQEESWCTTPQLFMYPDDTSMIASIHEHIELCKKELQCKNSEIAVITFEDSLLYKESLAKLSEEWQKEVFLLKDRETIDVRKITAREDPIILSSPYNVNGLEFKCVILVGVDEGRVPKITGTEDVSANYIKYSAFNQLYLTSSRAKFRLILIGNSLHGTSSCLQYALENGRVIKTTK